MELEPGPDFLSQLRETLALGERIWKAAHDVSQEPRDGHGRWTSGGGASLGGAASGHPALEWTTDGKGNWRTGTYSLHRVPKHGYILSYWADPKGHGETIGLFPKGDYKHGGALAAGKAAAQAHANKIREQAASPAAGTEVRKAAHDVSQEPRDAHGRWTSGGGASRVYACGCEGKATDSHLGVTGYCPECEDFVAERSLNYRTAQFAEHGYTVPPVPDEDDLVALKERAESPIPVSEMQDFLRDVSVQQRRAELQFEHFRREKVLIVNQGRQLQAKANSASAHWDELRESFDEALGRVDEAHTAAAHWHNYQESGPVIPGLIMFRRATQAAQSALDEAAALVTEMKREYEHRGQALPHPDEVAAMRHIRRRRYGD